jgi:hypothetical protein
MKKIIGDIGMNYRNLIINVRSFGSNKKTVVKLQNLTASKKALL